MGRAVRVLALVVSAAGASVAVAQPADGRSARVVSTERVVHESAAAYASAPVLSLVPMQSWCTDVDAEGCAVRGFLHAQLLPDGGVLASDMNPPVRRFAASGAYTGSLVRSGSGPGEVRNIVALRYIAGDSLDLFANAEMRYARVAIDGGRGRSATMMPPLTTFDMGFLGSTPVAWTMGRVQAVGDLAIGALVALAEDSARQRTVVQYELPSLYETGSGEFIRPPAPLTPFPSVATGAGGDAAFSSGRAFVVHVVPAVGARWRLVADIPPRDVTAAERDSVVRTVRDRAERMRRDPRMKNASAQAEAGLANMPRRHAAITALAMLRDGSLAIRTTPAANSSHVRWDLFARDGTRLGRFTLGLQQNILDGDAGQLLVGRIDDAGVPSLTRYRVVRSPTE